MTNIYIESRDLKTPEAIFLKTYLSHLGIDSSSYTIIPLNGKDNLRNARNQFLQNTLEEGVNLIVFDADSPDNMGGYRDRKQQLKNLLQELEIEAEIFLFPNDSEDGDFESLLEGTARSDTFKRFFDCFHDYELCLGDEYVHPNRKAKMHTYITSMKLSNAQRKKLGSGFWLFEEEKYWDLKAEILTPLKSFLKNHIIH